MMNSFNVTSADVVAYMTALRNFPAGFDVRDFAEGDAISIGNTTQADLTRGVDGAAAYWYIPSITEVSINLMPGSETSEHLLDIANNVEQMRRPDKFSLSVQIPSLGVVVDFTDGTLTTYPAMANVKTRLDPQRFTFKFAHSKVSRF